MILHGHTHVYLDVCTGRRIEENLEIDKVYSFKCPNKCVSISMPAFPSNAPFLKIRKRNHFKITLDVFCLTIQHLHGQCIEMHLWKGPWHSPSSSAQIQYV